MKNTNKLSSKVSFHLIDSLSYLKIGRSKWKKNRTNSLNKKIQNALFIQKSTNSNKIKLFLKDFKFIPKNTETKFPIKKTCDKTRLITRPEKNYLTLRPEKPLK